MCGGWGWGWGEALDHKLHRHADVNIHGNIIGSVTKNCLYNFDPLKPHFFIVKLGFTGVFIIFSYSAKNIDCGLSLEPPRRGGSNGTHNLCFEQKYEKYQNLLSENFQVLEVKFSVYLNRHVFVMHDVCSLLELRPLSLS